MRQPELPEIPRSAMMTTQEYAYLRLRNAVMIGALPPGTALTFRGLAEQRLVDSHDHVRRRSLSFERDLVESFSRGGENFVDGFTSGGGHRTRGEKLTERSRAGERIVSVNGDFGSRPNGKRQQKNEPSGTQHGRKIAQSRRGRKPRVSWCGRRLWG